MNAIDPTSLLAVVQTDSADGRLLCPQCGGRLYLAVTRINTGVPVWASNDADEPLSYDPDEDGGSSEQTITDAYCDTCRWAAVADGAAYDTVVPDPSPADKVLVTRDDTDLLSPWDVWQCGPDMAWRVASYADLNRLREDYPTFTVTALDGDVLTTPRGRRYPDRATCLCGAEARTVAGYGPVVCPECQGDAV